MRVFQHDDGIRALGHVAAGVHQRGLPRLQDERGARAHRHLGHNIQVGGQPGRCAVGVGGLHGIAIHRAADERRQVVRRRGVLCQHPVERVDHRARLRADDGRETGPEDLPGFFSGA